MTKKLFKDIYVNESEFNILKMIRDYQYELECEMDNLNQYSVAYVKACQRHNGLDILLNRIYNNLKHEQTENYKKENGYYD